MNRWWGTIRKLADGLHHYLLGLIVASYVLAALVPGPGLWIKETKLADGPLGAVTWLKILLALLLFNAGVRVKLGRIGEMARRPGSILAGLATNLVVPLGFLAAMVPLMPLWHNPDEAAIVLVGLAMVAAMPIAGSSTGWAQATDGDMALSLGLVLGSTLLSPVTTPVLLETLGAIAPGSHGDELKRVAHGGTGGFLALWVLLPSLVGIATRAVVGEGRAKGVEAATRAVGPLALMVLCYSNASACLPDTVRNPDWDFLGIILVFVVGLCLATFAAGLGLGRLLGVGRPQRVALTFGLGMNNNGTSLVLSSLALGSGPQGLLPILIYNLTQHLMAGTVKALILRGELEPADTDQRIPARKAQAMADRLQ